MVKDVAKKSMQKAVDEVRALPEYSAKGEVGIVVSFMLVFCILYVMCYRVGDDRCQARFNIQCLPYYRRMSVWKVGIVICRNV